MGPPSRRLSLLASVGALVGRSSIPTTLYQFMSTEGHRNVTHPQGGSWTPADALKVIGWLDRRQVESS